MKFQKILRIAWEGLMLNKVRSFLTTLGVIIGVASVIVMMSISAGAEAAIAEQINSLGANLLIVSPMRGVPGAARTLLYEDALAISEQVIGISGVSAEQAPAPQTVKANGTHSNRLPLSAPQQTSPPCVIIPLPKACISPKRKMTANSKWLCWEQGWQKTCSAKKARWGNPSPWAAPN
jgi:predicted lysophospholipase L1 biosynthesis ABC-type transport system permease subunit